MIKRFSNWIRSLFSHNEQEQKVNTPFKSKLVEKGKKPKKVSEMSQDEKTYHFLEQRANWLMKSGYNLNIHLPADPKPDKEPSHYRAMMLKAHKIAGEKAKISFEDSKLQGLLKRNKKGIQTLRYSGL